MTRRARCLLLVAAVLGSAAGGCSSIGGPTAEANGRVERCTDRLVQRAAGPRSAAADSYVRKTYCRPFDERGWVYDDGTLRIDAYLALERGGTCATAKAGEPVRTVPCEELEPPDPKILDCALLHIVRRREVQEYLARLQRGREVRCDDGTPIGDLGVD